MVCLVYNFIQHLRLYLDGMSFKDALEELSAYLLWKSPPKCVFTVEKELNRVFGDIGFKGSDKMDIGSMGSMEILERATA